MDQAAKPDESDKTPAPSGKVFKKCKSATFQIDGATYTIGKLGIGLKVMAKFFHAD